MHDSALQFHFANTKMNRAYRVFAINSREAGNILLEAGNINFSAIAATSSYFMLQLTNARFATVFARFNIPDKTICTVYHDHCAEIKIGTVQLK
jgi:hypothetical protein